VVMSSNGHYRKAMELLAEVEAIEQNHKGKVYEPDEALALNAIMMRIIQKAELHMQMAEYKKSD
jgi:hypothetical protein